MTESAGADHSPAVVLHGGTPARRAALGRALRDAKGLGAVRIRLSSRAAEAAKCLADPAIVAVILIDTPTDAEQVRQLVLVPTLRRHTYHVEPRDDADVVVRLVRTAIEARHPGSPSGSSSGATDRP